MATDELTARKQIEAALNFLLDKGCDNWALQIRAALADRDRLREERDDAIARENGNADALYTALTKLAKWREEFAAKDAEIQILKQIFKAGGRRRREPNE